MDPKCQVKVKQGVLQGKVATSYNGTKFYSFEGIPYAKPPLGKLRFLDPQPPEPWIGIRDALKPGSPCAQTDPYRQTRYTGSEDCLHLNVYAPVVADTNKKLPVIVYIHGGRYIVGYGDYYKPDFFLDKEVIVVSINYRLHILGFLCLHTPEVPGNAGLKDAIAALRWVQDNIEVFGGDKNNVTAFGESAGSGTVTALLATKMSDNLFHKAIGESGSCLSDLFMKNEDKIAKAQFIVKQLGFDTDNVDEMYEILQNAKVEELVKAIVVAQNSHSDINAYFMPVIEKKFDGVEPFFLEDPWILHFEGRLKKMPLLFGIMSHEGAYFMNRNEKGEIMYDNNLENFLPRYANLGFKKGSRKSVLIAEILRNYYFNGAKIDDTKKTEYLEFVSDAYFNKVLIMNTDYLSRNNKNVFYFRFAYEGSLNTRLMKELGLKGASHGDVLPYQFYRKNKMDKCTDKDMRVINLMSESITNFAKTGKPSFSGQKEPWLPYDEKTRMTLDIADEVRVKPYVCNERVNFWKQLLWQKSRL